MVFKFLGIGKKSEYFLEAPPSSNGASQEAPAPAAKPAAEEPAKPVEAAPAATTNGSTPAPAAAPAQPAAKKLKKTKAEATPAVPAQPAAVQPAAKPAPEIKNFATNGLMPMNTPRRRPGPSLAMFKDMARDVTPRK